ncbi:MAG TPA: serine hydrolase [Holophagaceae bacterium]|nr:serine hydrolase [Holophagaceae bacterium]
MVHRLGFALALPAALTAGAPEGRPADQLWRKLEAAVAREAAQLDGVLGVAILDLTDGRELLVNADTTFPTASTIKVAVLAELYRQSQAAGAALPVGAGTEPQGPGQARLSDLYTLRSQDLVADSYVLGGLTPGVSRLTNRDLATCMVAVSDNAATNLLIDRVGLPQVNAFLERQGLKETRLRRRMMDLSAAQAGRENVATPRELAQLLATLHRGQVLDAAHTADFFKVLATPKDGYLPRLLPEELRVAGKPGSLDGVRCDAGLVFLKDRPFIVVAMTSFLREEREGEQAISRVGLAAFRTFEALAVSSVHGRAWSARSFK